MPSEVQHFAIFDKYYFYLKVFLSCFHNIMIDHPLRAALTQEEALRGYQPWSGGGERQRDLEWGGLPEPGRCAARPLWPTLPPLPLLQVDPMLTLEEQQLRELQRHGYENPTYRFLEERP